MVSIVVSIRSRVSVVAIIAAFCSATAPRLLAMSPGHAVCALNQHTCDHGPRLVRCCCPEPGDSSSDATPAADTFRVAPSFAPTFLVTAPLHVPAAWIDYARRHASPPRFSPTDLLTLFSTLLI